MDPGAVDIPLAEWEVLGPFPAGMREHPFLSSPLQAYAPSAADLCDPPTDPDLAFALGEITFGSPAPPSAYVSGGRALWRRVSGTPTSGARIAFPEVDWRALRRDRGWASIQYSVLARSWLVIPDTGRDVRVRVDANCAECAFVRSGDEQVVWHKGDVYDFASTPSGQEGVRPGAASNFARALALRAGRYAVLVRAVYEVRVFGDSDEPAIDLKFRVVPDIPPLPRDSPPQPELELGHGALPDIVDGWLMGQWAVLEVRALPGSGSRVVTAFGRLPGVFFVSGEVRVAAGQTRRLAMRITQSAPITVESVDITVDGAVTVSLPLTHQKMGEAFRMTFASPEGYWPACVSTALVVPPQKGDKDTDTGTDTAKEMPPVLLALHGAGVDFASPFWASAMPSIPGMWAVLPSGRNEWGEDWHGSSLADAWAARDALAPTLAAIGVTVSHETVLLGHSNGGQGAWYAAMRYPARIRGVIAIAGYTSITDYVPYTELIGRQYADPALLGILAASLAGYDDALHASNLASVPVLAVHGGEDDNVPPRHGRTHFAVLSSWLHTHQSPDVTYLEVPGMPHWWDGILRHPAIISFLRALPPQRTVDEVRDAGFTLTCANPDENGGKAGIRIIELAVPGRLARLDVNAPQWRRDGGLVMRGMNIRRIELSGQGGTQVVERRNGNWVPEGGPRPVPPVRAYGPMIRLLASVGPMIIVVPDMEDTDSDSNADHPTSAAIIALATAYAHDLHVYHRLDSVLLPARQALRDLAAGQLGAGNVVVLGRPEENLFSAWMVAQRRTPVSFPTQGLLAVDERVVWERGAGIIALHPHPTSTSARALAALVAGNDLAGLYRAARLLPLRTGVPVPDWAVVTPRCAWQGAGGLAGAGFWSGNWGWSEMCWMDRE